MLNLDSKFRLTEIEIEIKTKILKKEIVVNPLSLRLYNEIK